MEINDRIRAALQQKGMTQKQLAAAVGVTESVVSKWINTKQNFTFDTIRRIEKATGITIIETTEPSFSDTIFSSYIPQRNSFESALFWEYDPKTFNPSEHKELVVGRVLERGTLNDYFAAFDACGGIDNFKETVKNLKDIDKYSVNFICLTLGINKKDLKCCTQKQSNRRPLNF